MNRGSEWRQWDLHFHTPSSYDYENKSVTNQDIIDELVNAGVEAVVITDHHVIDVKRIKELQHLGTGKITVFPGIEFLSDARGNEPIHFIGIFSERSDLDYIWGQIENRTNIHRIKGEGKQINEVYCDLKDTCELVHELGGIVSIHAGTKSNGLDKITNSLPHTEAQKDDISRYIDIFDMGKVKDLEGYRKFVFPSIRRIVPMIISSDNHNVKNYQRKEKTWIKADCTFEGLKQILFEPEERVSVCCSKPEEKSVYNVIDYISFSEPGFWDGTISLNQNLNAIIGGRSTGKSSLIDVIAAKHKCAELDKDNYIWKHINNVSIGWADGNSELDRDIDFFPQSYMHKIARNKDKTNELVERIILHKDEGGLIKLLQEQEQKNKKLISESIFRMFSLYDELVKEKKKLSEQGNKDGVKQQISLLEQQIAEIQKNSSLSEEENVVYQSLDKELKNKEMLIKKADQDIDILHKIRSISPIKSNYETESDMGLLSFGNNLSVSKKQIKELKERTDREWESIIDEIIKATQGNRSSLENDKSNILNNVSYKKGMSYYVGNNELKLLSEKVVSETKIIQEIEKIESRIKSLREQLNQLKKEVLDAHLEFKLNSQNVVNNLSVDVDGLMIKVNKDFQKDRMRELLENRLSVRGTIRRGYIENFIDNYDTDTQNQVQKLLLDLIKGDVELKGSTKPLSLATEILGSNWYTLNYQLNYQGDTFDRMSEGKQAFVILKLLLEFSDKQCPILIDQPEDSLDNRAIYNELVGYIKNKKKTRQIILVTHNSNVVVAADAENVIVANQNGSDSPNDSGNQFQYVNGSLENTKLKNDSNYILESQGIREHVCEILEGGRDAFKKREQKYGFNYKS